jgi:hypothetical protein
LSILGDCNQQHGLQKLNVYGFEEWLSEKECEGRLARSTANEPDFDCPVLIIE